MPDRFMRLLKHIIDNPYLNIVVSLLLLFSAISETVHEFKRIHEFKFGVHHGIILFAILHILKSFPDLFEGLEYIDKAGDEKHK